MKGACGITGTAVVGPGMNGEGSSGRPRITEEAAVLAARELANSRICPGGNVRGLTATHTNITVHFKLVKQNQNTFYFCHFDLYQKITRSIGLSRW